MRTIQYYIKARKGVMEWESIDENAEKVSWKDNAYEYRYDRIVEAWDMFVK